ncbi:unnamed protein product [Peniophora sp. CBMAI 1063]|nr:unnamed protein product [Peniophora sp. CBMAI 1063]
MSAFTGFTPEFDGSSLQQGSFPGQFNTGCDSTSFVMNTEAQVAELKSWANLVGNDCTLTPEQITDLHINVDSMKNCLHFGDIQSRIHMFALIYSVQNEQKQQRVKLDKWNQLIDITLRQWEERFALTRSQHNRVIKKLKVRVWEPQRTCWADLATDLEKEMKADSKFADVYEEGKDNGVEVLRDDCKLQAKGARGILCLDCYDTMLVTAAKNSGMKELGEATLYIADKLRSKSFYLLSNPIPVRYQIHTALLRRFTYENQWYQWVLKSVEKRGEDGEEVEVSKKRKGPGGRVAKGKDYWPMVNTWFAKLLGEKGDDLNSEAWKEYYLETVCLDRQRFGHGAMPAHRQKLLEPLGPQFDVPVTPRAASASPEPPAASSSTGPLTIQQMCQQQMAQ